MASRIAIVLPMLFLLPAISLSAQATASPVVPSGRPAEASATSFAFDAVSIRPSVADIRNFGGGFIASGYRGTNYPLAQIVFMAYLSSFKGNEMIGMPAWAVKEHYDIVAHIDESSAPSWLALNPRQRWEAGRPMLQKLLAERCNLVVHTVPAEVSGYALIVGKRGSHLHPAEPRETYPDGVKDLDPEGGKALSATPANNNTMRFFNVLIPDLVDLIGATTTSVIQDETNLTGRYDFTVRRQQIPRDVDGKPISNPEPADFWDLSGTGLEFRSGKVPSQNLVIDHIERPSPN